MRPRNGRQRSAARGGWILDAAWWLAWLAGLALATWQLVYGLSWAYEFVVYLRMAVPASVEVTSLPPTPRIARRLLSYGVVVRSAPGAPAFAASLRTTVRHEVGDRLTAYALPETPAQLRERAWGDLIGGVVLALITALFAYALLFHLQPWAARR